MKEKNETNEHDYSSDDKIKKLKIENQELKDEIEKLKKLLNQQNSETDTTSKAETESESSTQPIKNKKDPSSFFKLQSYMYCNCSY